MKTSQACHAIVVENSYASGQKKRPRGPRSDHGALVSVPQRPLVDLKQTAITYYVHYHLQALTDADSISKSFSNDFLPIWESKADCPILDLALSSKALAVFSRTQQHPPAAIEASMTYHRLLRIAQKTILSLDAKTIDAYLLAIFFMGRYEDTIYIPPHVDQKTPFAATLHSFSHHDGALATLRLWKECLSHVHPATDIIKHTRRGMIRSALIRDIGLPSCILEGSSFGEHGLELEYDGIIVQLANIRQRLSTLLKESSYSQCRSPEFIATAEELNREVAILDQALLKWAAQFPSTWNYQQHSLPKNHPWPTEDFYSPVVYSYLKPAQAAVWNQYYSTRMLVNSTRLRALNTKCLTNEERLECLYNIKIMANDLASSVPYCLHKFKVADTSSAASQRTAITLDTKEDIMPSVADLTVWPLTIASSLADLDVKQKSWFRFQLARLGRVIGAGVLECAESDQWLDGSMFGLEKVMSKPKGSYASPFTLQSQSSCSVVSA